MGTAPQALHQPFSGRIEVIHRFCMATVSCALLVCSQTITAHPLNVDPVYGNHRDSDGTTIDPVWGFEVPTHPQNAVAAASSSTQSCNQLANANSGFIGGLSVTEFYELDDLPRTPDGFVKKAICEYDWQPQPPTGDTYRAHLELYRHTHVVCDPTQNLENHHGHTNSPHIEHRSSGCYFKWSPIAVRNTGETCVAAGNPIGLAIGNKFQAETDFAYGNLIFKRYYNSALEEWRHEYQRSIEVADRLDDSSSPNRRVYWGWYHSKDGRSVPFVGETEVGGSIVVPFTVPDDEVVRIVPTVDSTGTVSDWTLFTENNNTEFFSGDGVLQSIESIRGDRVTLNYVSGDLSSVVDRSGRSLLFTYASGQLEQVSIQSGHEVNFTYDANGMLEYVLYPDDTPGTNSDNPRRRYHYENANPRLLTGITDESGNRFATWSYDINGLANSSSHSIGANNTTIAYDHLNFDYNLPAASTVTNSLGKNIVVSMAPGGGKPHIIEITKQAAAISSESTRSVSRDSSGFPNVVTDERNIQTDYDYDGRGLVTSKIEALGTSEERTTGIAWHPTYRLPETITKPNQTIQHDYTEEGLVKSTTVK